MYAPGVPDAFVDLSYRGLSLGRRIKLTQVRPRTGYLEHPTPMPVGTRIAVATDDVVGFDAVVIRVHEQIGGSDRAPGMMIEPALADAAGEAWWRERVTLPEAEPDAPPVVPVRARAVTVQPRSRAGSRPPAEATATAAPAPPPAPPVVPPPAPPVVAPAAPEPVESGAVAAEADDGETRKTTVMDAVDQELLEQLSREPAELEHLVRTTGEQPVVDDGKLTMIMEAVDPSMIEAELADDSVVVAAANGDDDGGDPEPAGAPAAPGAKKRKPRKKKR